MNVFLRIRRLIIAVPLMFLPCLSVFAADTSSDSPFISNVKTVVSSSAESLFAANIVDHAGMESVVLFYRQLGDAGYRSVAMTQSGIKDRYSAVVQMQSAGDAFFDYYIDARNRAGKRTLSRYSYDPLQLVATQAVSESAAKESGAVQSSVQKSSSKTVLYTVLGVLAVGALLGASGSDSGGDSAAVSAGGDGCSAQGCLLTITAPTRP